MGALIRPLIWIRNRTEKSLHWNNDTTRCKGCVCERQGLQEETWDSWGVTCCALASDLTLTKPLNCCSKCLRDPCEAEGMDGKQSGDSVSWVSLGKGGSLAMVYRWIMWCVVLAAVMSGAAAIHTTLADTGRGVSLSCILMRSPVLCEKSVILIRGLEFLGVSTAFAAFILKFF